MLIASWDLSAEPGHLPKGLQAAITLPTKARRVVYGLGPRFRSEGDLRAQLI